VEALRDRAHRHTIEPCTIDRRAPCQRHHQERRPARDLLDGKAGRADRGDLDAERCGHGLDVVDASAEGVAEIAERAASPAAVAAGVGEGAQPIAPQHRLAVRRPRAVVNAPDSRVTPGILD
jgi:hypothetical protein